MGAKPSKRRRIDFNLSPHEPIDFHDHYGRGVLVYEAEDDPLEHRKKPTARIPSKTARVFDSASEEPPGNGYVFSNRPISINEHIFLIVEKCNRLLTDDLYFGLTTISPDIIDIDCMPDDPADLLLFPNNIGLVCCLKTTGWKDGHVVGVTITSNGALELLTSVSNEGRRILGEVDPTQKLYMWWKLGGRVRAVKILSIAKPRNGGPSTDAAAPQVQPSAPPIDDDDDDGGSNEDQHQPSDVMCRVCYDSRRECALLPCLHVSLCLSCATQLHARQAKCPICREDIDDVLPIFLS